MADYACNHCGHLFNYEDADVYVETHGFEHGPFEKIIICPECGDSNIDDPATCSECGEEFAPDYLITLNNGDSVCEDCYEDVPDEYKE